MGCWPIHVGPIDPSSIRVIVFSPRVLKNIGKSELIHRVEPIFSTLDEASGMGCGVADGWDRWAWRGGFNYRLSCLTVIPI